MTVRAPVCRCLVEAGFDFSPDALPDPAAWEQMLDKSPIRHVAKVRGTSWVRASASFQGAIETRFLSPHAGENSGAVHPGRGRQARPQQAGRGVLPSAQGKAGSSSVSQSPAVHRTAGILVAHWLTPPGAAGCRQAALVPGEQPLPVQGGRRVGRLHEHRPVDPPPPVTPAGPCGTTDPVLLLLPGPV